MPLQQTAFVNIVAQGASSHCATMCSTLFIYYTLVYRDFPHFLLMCFQSCLLQTSCMWERVNLLPDMVFKELSAFKTSKERVEKYENK